MEEYPARATFKHGRLEISDGITMYTLGDYPGIYISHTGAYGTAILALLAFRLGWTPHHDARDGLEMASRKLYPVWEMNLSEEDEDHLYWTSTVAQEWLNLQIQRHKHMRWSWKEDLFGLWERDLSTETAEGHILFNIQ